MSKDFLRKRFNIDKLRLKASKDELIEAGRVKINGVSAVIGSKVNPGDDVTLDGEPVTICDEKHLYAFNKPVGYITSLSDEQGEGIARFVPEGMRLFPVGRLDKDSEGLILLTDDGELMNKILNASLAHEKEYIVTTDRKIDDDFIEAMQKGVKILNKATGQKIVTAPCRAYRIDDYHFRIILIQGLNRQIRRMSRALGYNVTGLKRIRIVNIELGNLQVGEIRKIDEQGIAKLWEEIDG